MTLLRGEKKDYVLRFTVPTGYERVTIEPSARYPDDHLGRRRPDLAGQQRPQIRW